MTCLFKFMQFDISFDDADSKPKRKIPSRFAARMKKPEKDDSGNPENATVSSQPNDSKPVNTEYAYRIHLNCSESQHIRKVAHPLCTDSSTIYTKDSCISAVIVSQTFNS